MRRMKLLRDSVGNWKGKLCFFPGNSGRKCNLLLHFQTLTSDSEFPLTTEDMLGERKKRKTGKERGGGEAMNLSVRANTQTV